MNLEWEEPDSIIMCDATLERSAGWCEGQFFTQPFPEELLKLVSHINELECITVTACMKIWSQKCQGKKLLLRCDNKATVMAVNTGCSKNRIMQACLRELHHICSLNSCRVRLKYIATKLNTIADCLSRIHTHKKFKKKFEQLTLGMEKHQIKLEKEIFLFQFTTL